MKEIVIIGGGIAGLSAAAELLRNDCAVTILEAKERLGGRVHTIRDHEIPIELGAEFLHGENKTVSNVIQAAELSTHDVPDRNQVLDNGKLHSVKLWSKIGKIIHRIKPRQRDQSFQDFIDGEKLSTSERRLAIGFVNGFHAARTERISAHALLRGEVSAEQMAGSTQARINQGYSALVDFLEQDIRAHGGKIETGKVVKRVRWRSGKVEVFIGGLRRPAARPYPKVFDTAIITLSLGVLKAGTVEFDPPLTAKQEAIDGLQFGNVVKVTLVFREQWWPKFGFIHDFDAPIPTWWTDPRGPVLTGWAGGPKADKLLSVSSLEGITGQPGKLNKKAIAAHDRNLFLARLKITALKVLGRIFSEKPSTLRKQLLAMHAHNWAADPLVRGAYSYIPVNGLEFPKLLAAPIKDTLYFAGEATVMDAQNGTVFGAYESGLRAGREVLAEI